MKVKRFKLNALSKESLRQKEMSAIVGRPLVHKAKKRIYEINYTYNPLSGIFSE